MDNPIEWLNKHLLRGELHKEWGMWCVTTPYGVTHGVSHGYIQERVYRRLEQLGIMSEVCGRLVERLGVNLTLSMMDSCALAVLAEYARELQLMQQEGAVW